MTLTLEGEEEYHWNQPQPGPADHERLGLEELTSEFDEAKHPRANDGKFGSGGGSSKADPQRHFDETAKAVDSVAKAGGHLSAIDRFLNVDRVTVSRAEREGVHNQTSDDVTRFLHAAQAHGATYKGPVFRGTSQKELDTLLRTGASSSTMSVSKDPDGSAKFAKKAGVLLVIHNNSGAVPVDGIEGSNTFHEALIPKGSKFKVKSQREKAGVKIVELERDSSPAN